jgi:8-oxo-dGTP pyrophosphatase MutT (NUDIX family)
LEKFPGGHGESGETPEEVAAREVFEETGIRVDPRELRLLSKESKGKHDVYIFFVLRPPRGRPAVEQGWQ